MWWPIDLSPSEHIAIASIYLAFWTSLKWEMVGSECYSDSGASFSYFHTHTHAHIKKISKCSFSYLTFHPHKFYFRSLWKEILKNQSEDFVFQHQMFVPFSPFLLADCVFSIFSGSRIADISTQLRLFCHLLLWHALDDNWHHFLHFHFHGNSQRYFRRLTWKIPIRVDAAIVRIHWIRVKKQGHRGQVSLKVRVSGLSPKNLLSAWKIYKQFTLRDFVSFVICIALLTERGE